jgi:hypothetical protein
VHVEAASDGGAAAQPRETGPPLEIPPQGSGERLGFLLGMQPSRPSCRGAAEARIPPGLPPVSAGAGAGSSRKRRRLPTDGGRQQPKKGKQLAGAQPGKATSPW